MTFYNERTSLADKGRTVNIAYLDFRKVFNTVFHQILIEKLMQYGLGEQTGGLKTG